MTSIMSVRIKPHFHQNNKIGILCKKIKHTYLVMYFAFFKVFALAITINGWELYEVFFH